MIPILYPSPRVSQLDAHILDTELSGLLKQHLQSIFRLQTNKWWGYDKHPDFYDLLLNVLVFYLTVVRNGSSYGLSLQNLKLADFSTGRAILSNKRWLLLAVLIGEYLFRRLQSHLYAIDDLTTGQRKYTSIIGKLKALVYKHRTVLLSKANDCFKILNLVNFLLFLVNGRYPTVVHRLLNVCLTPISGDLLRFNGDSVNYEFQNRQLVWNVMTEFLVFILPLLQLSKMKRMAAHLIKLSSRGDSSQERDKIVITAYTKLPLSQCAVCHEQEDYLTRMSGAKTKAPTYTITNPYVTNCGHIYCYVCLAGRFNAIENGNEDAEACPRCRQKLVWFKEFGTEDSDIEENAIMVELQDVEEDIGEQATERIKQEENQIDDDERIGSYHDIALKELAGQVSMDHTDVEEGFSEGEELQEDIGDDDIDDDEIFDDDEFDEILE